MSGGRQVITIGNFHGGFNSSKAGLERARTLDKIAHVVTSGQEWEFDGTIGQFADAYPFNFMVMRLEKGTHIWVTQYGSFGQR